MKLKTLIITYTSYLLERFTIFNLFIKLNYNLCINAKLKMFLLNKIQNKYLLQKIKYSAF